MDRIFAMDNKADMEGYLKTWTGEGLKKRKSDLEFYMKKNCSPEALNTVLLNRYGRCANKLRKDEEFNIWEAYSFLKTYCGINDVTLTQEEYRKRMNVITELLGV